MKKYLFFSLACISFIYSHTQNLQPGGVDTTNLRVWFRGDNLTLGNVSGWPSTIPSGPNTFVLTKVSNDAKDFPQATNSMPNRGNNYNTVVNFHRNTPTNNITLGNSTNLTTITWTGNGTSGGAGTWFMVYFISPQDTVIAPTTLPKHMFHNIGNPLQEAMVFSLECYKM